jgi:hypothetical protein
MAPVTVNKQHIAYEMDPLKYSFLLYDKYDLNLVLRNRPYQSNLTVDFVIQPLIPPVGFLLMACIICFSRMVGKTFSSRTFGRSLKLQRSIDGNI